MAKRKKGKAKAAGGSRWREVLGGFLFGQEVEEEVQDRLTEIKGLLLVAFSVWLLVSLGSFYTPHDDPGAEGWNWGGDLGHYLATYALVGCGLAAYLVAVLGILWGCVIVARRHVSMPTLRVVGGVSLTMSLALLLNLAFGPTPEQVAEMKQLARLDELGVGSGAGSVLDNRLPYGPGGWFAIEVTPRLVARFGDPGLWILLVAMVLVSFALATEMAFLPALQSLVGWLRDRRERWGEETGPAVWGWFRGLFLGLWDFIRGAELGEAALAGAGGGAGRGGRAGTGGKGSGKAAAKKPRSKKASVAVAEQEAEDVWDDSEGEWVEDDGAEGGEWEDGTAYAEEDAEAEDGEWEWEDEEADGEDPEAAGASGAEHAEDAEDAEDADEEEYEYEYEFDEEEGEEFVEEAPELFAEADDGEDYDPDELDEDEVALATAEITPAAKKQPVRAPKIAEPRFEPPTPPPGPWTLPPLDLLEPPVGGGGEDRDFLENSARALEGALKSFRVEAEVVGAQVGPAVTMFELTVAQGTRMNRVTALSQEIAATLRARSVRIIAPIPGKSTIGIEVPNKKRRMVRISELVSQKAYDPTFMALPLFLGMDAEGNAIVEDLARMPHLLIAGTTGSGKSVCINTIIASFMLTRSPHDVRLILVDPKMVELQMFQVVPHLELPVVTDMRQATNVLLWAVEKMEGRYDLFKNAGVKNIKTYNALGEEKLRERMGEEFNEERTPRHVPYIVLIIDEMADLMMQSKKEAEQAITRLAQKSRAVGIHVIVATQRPSTDVITGVIKGNLPCRIAFQVASKIDSRVILDAMGAEKLLGQGDMLYTPPQTGQLRRVQGALVEDHELQGLVDFVSKESVQTFNQELIQTASGQASGSGNPYEDAMAADELFDDAVRVILKTRRGSASLLQRALGIGYTRASRLIDLMTEAGIVGEHKGSKAREILMTLEDWEEMYGTPLGPGTADG